MNCLNLPLNNYLFHIQIQFLLHYPTRQAVTLSMSHHSTRTVPHEHWYWHHILWHPVTGMTFSAEVSVNFLKPLWSQQQEHHLASLWKKAAHLNQCKWSTESSDFTALFSLHKQWDRREAVHPQPSCSGWYWTMSPQGDIKWQSLSVTWAWGSNYRSSLLVLWVR